MDTFDLCIWYIGLQQINLTIIQENVEIYDRKWHWIVFVVITGNNGNGSIGAFNVVSFLEAYQKSSLKI